MPIQPSILPPVMQLPPIGATPPVDILPPTDEPASAELMPAPQQSGPAPEQTNDLGPLEPPTEIDLLLLGDLIACHVEAAVAPEVVPIGPVDATGQNCLSLAAQGLIGVPLKFIFPRRAE